jgi:predicted phage terminase large subunit-like protein
VQVKLHEKQAEIFYDPTRYKVVAAGRRFGKSFLAAVTLFVEASKTEKVRSDGVTVDLGLEEVYYVAPTFDQGKKIMWPLLKELGQSLIRNKWENTGELELVNGRRVCIKGSDRPDTLRGVGLSYVVLDEFAFMKEEVWDLIIRPALTRAEGGALFIGTPDGKNHFWNLYQRGLSENSAEWKSWHFPSSDNPYLPKSEIDAARVEMSTERYKQEYEASFEGGAGVLMRRDMFPILGRRPDVGEYFVAIDLAGFEAVESGRKIKRLDDHAIAVVLNHSGGWCIEDIIYGQWDVRETALRIVKAFRDYRPTKLGIEKGMAKNAVMPYLLDEMNRLGVFFNVEDLTHGNNKKTDRIAWALQGRAEKGRIQVVRGAWNKEFFDQVEDFPSPLAHDDLLDAVSYIDQLADPWMDGPSTIDEWQPLDQVSGY